MPARMVVSPLGPDRAGLESGPEADLVGMRKLDLRKQVLAWWVRQPTAVSNRWVSETLHMGIAGNISKVIASVEAGANRELRAIKKRVIRGRS